MIALLLILLVAAVAAVSRDCYGGGECEQGMFCVEQKFCLDDAALNYGGTLFVAGAASAFVQAGNVDEAQCLVDIEADIQAFIEALQYWQNGDYVETGSRLLEALQSFQSAIADCVQDGQEEPRGGFWDAIWDGVKWFIGALCPECEVLIDDAQLVVAGVDIIEDWVSMAENCLGTPDADQIMDCGAAFGDSVIRIAQAARAAEAEAVAVGASVDVYEQK